MQLIFGALGEAARRETWRGSWRKADGEGPCGRQCGPAGKSAGRRRSCRHPTGGRL